MVRFNFNLNMLESKNDVIQGFHPQLAFFLATVSHFQIYMTVLQCTVLYFYSEFGTMFKKMVGFGTKSTLISVCVICLFFVMSIVLDTDQKNVCVICPHFV